MLDNSFCVSCVCKFAIWYVSKCLGEKTGGVEEIGSMMNVAIVIVIIIGSV